MNNPLRWRDPTGLFAEFYIPGGLDGGGDSRNIPDRVAVALSLTNTRAITTNTVFGAGVAVAGMNRMYSYAAGISYAWNNPVSVITSTLTNPIALMNILVPYNPYQIVQSMVSNVNTIRTYGIEHGFGMIVGDVAVAVAPAVIYYGTGKVLKYISSKVTTHEVNWRTGDGYPRPPGLNDQWQWRYPEAKLRSDTNPRWFDPQGGEWRWHQRDPWHSVPHWDYNPWRAWNDQWRNIMPPFRP